MTIKLPVDSGSDPTGNTGSGGGGGGSSPSPVNLALLPVTGGLAGFVNAFLIPCFDSISGQSFIYQLDPTNFDTEESCEYRYKIEEAEPVNKLTIHNICIKYRDLGQFTFTVSIVNSDEVASSKKIILGGKADKKIRSKLVNMQATIEDPQVIITRDANSGPLSITKVIVYGSYGDGDII